MASLNKIVDLKTSGVSTPASLESIIYSIVVGGKEIQAYDNTKTYNKGDLVYIKNADESIEVKECTRNGTTNTLANTNWKGYSVSSDGSSSMSGQDAVSDIGNISLILNQMFGIDLPTLSNSLIIDFTDDSDYTLTTGFKIFGQLFI